MIEMKNIKLIDEDAEGNQLFHLKNEIFDITVVELADGTIYFPNDFQGPQCKSLENISEYNWLSEHELEIIIKTELLHS